MSSAPGRVPCFQLAYPEGTPFVSCASVGIRARRHTILDKIVKPSAAN